MWYWLEASTACLVSAHIDDGVGVELDLHTVVQQRDTDVCVDFLVDGPRVECNGRRARADESEQRVFRRHHGFAAIATATATATGHDSR